MSKLTEIFNSTTVKGRANVAKATYASFALLYVVHRLRNRGRKANAAKVDNGEGGHQNHKYKGESNHTNCHNHRKEPDIDSCSCGCSRKKADYHDHQDHNVSNGSHKTGHHNNSQGNDHSSSKGHVLDHDDRSVLAVDAVIHSSSKTCKTSSIGEDTSLKDIDEKHVTTGRKEFNV
ncbi:uncharacterized protein LOC105261768 isoform X1 [Musca domestica]|uniref:Uncharacterized protein LOC105261768 isoform X1 n=1 Tax=Musca domestica TaxID=7370 RepID=A0A9J7D7Q9_MUSDO|nr:uncharacterized protein LOC105261768 isoform X1 [Musca domestica]